MRGVMVGVAMAVIGIAGANAQSQVTITDDYFGCYKSDDLDLLMKMINQQDQEAVIRMVANRRCQLVVEGRRGFLQDTTFSTICFRPQGQTNCLWMPREAIQK